MIKRLTIGMLCLFAWVISHAQVVLPDNMEEAGIRYDDRDQEIFKIALTGGFGGFKLVEEQVRETFHFSSMDKRQKDIINVATDREKAVSMGAALVASRIIRIRNTAPYSIGFIVDSIVSTIP